MNKRSLTYLECMGQWAFSLENQYESAVTKFPFMKAF